MPQGPRVCRICHSRSQANYRLRDHSLQPSGEKVIRSACSRVGFKRVFNLKRQEVKQFTQLTDSVGWISQGIMTLKEEEDITRKTETTRSKQTLPIADVFFVFVFNNSPRRLFSQIPPGTHGKDCQFVQAGKTCGIHCSVHFKSVRQQKTSQTVRTFPTYDRYLVACGRSQLAEETRPNNYVTNMNPR